MEVSDVVSPPYLAGPLLLHPFRARMLPPSRIGDPASVRHFSRGLHGSAARLEGWEARNRLTAEGEPALYVHEYAVGATTVRGIVGALDLRHRTRSHVDSVVLPHEGIHPRQADDLADRMEERQLNPAPILLVHDGGPCLRRLMAQVTATPPVRQFADAGGQQHRLWALRGAEEVAAVAQALADARALIADGHHRYAAYLRMQARRSGTAADAGLAMLVDRRDTPLQLRPLHRALAGVRLDDLLGTLTALDIPVEFRPIATATDVDAATLALSDGHRSAVAVLPALAGAVVEFLHHVVLPALPRGPFQVSQHVDDTEAVAVAVRRRGTAVLLPPPTFEQVLDSARAGRLLPEKATSFQPKPHLGVIMRSLRAE